MASDGVEPVLKEMTFETKPAAFMIAFEMDQNEKEDKTSNANVSSNNSLESDDIHSELISDSVAEKENLPDYVNQRDHTSVSLKSIPDPTTQIVTDCTDDREYKTEIRAEIDANYSIDACSFPGTAENSLVSVQSDKKHDADKLYLPRSALISTSTGLSARENLDTTYDAVSGNDKEATGYILPHPANYTCEDQSDCRPVYELCSNIDNSTYPPNQLYYDSTGLAYTYNGYQLYASQSQPYYTEQRDSAHGQASCILTQCGETTYVSYLPADCLAGAIGNSAQGYTGCIDSVQGSNGYNNSIQGYNQIPIGSDYNQAQHFCIIPSETTIPAESEHNTQTVPENYISNNTQTTVCPEHETVNDVNWSTNDNDNSNQETHEELVGVYESESGEIIRIESLDNIENPANMYDFQTWNEYKPPEIVNDIPVKGDGLMRIENKSFDDLPADCPFPSLFVSDNGLITVLLRNGISLEMTPKRDLRLVNHSKKLVAATNNRGSSSIMIHPAIKLVQSGTTTEVDLFLARKAKMTTETITFGNNFSCYKFDYKKIVEEPYPVFRDLSEDESVDFLFDSEIKEKEALISECIQKSTEAHFDYFSNGGYKVFINGTKVVQNSRGDVYVTNGPKFLRMSPSSSRLGVQTHFIEATVEANWNVKIKRGTHMLNASHLGFVLSNGHIEAAFDDRNRLKVYRLPDRVPLRLGQNRQRRPGVYRRRYPYRGPESESEEDAESFRFYYH